MNSAPSKQIPQALDPLRSLALLPGPCLDPNGAKAIWFSPQWTLCLSSWSPLSDWPTVTGISSLGPWTSHSLSGVLAPAPDGQG